MTPAEIRAARAAQPRSRARDFAESHGIPEAALVAAFTGPEVVAVAADPRRLLPLARGLGPALALTRNRSAVQEREGLYGPLAEEAGRLRLVGEGIEMLIDPRHWVHAFAVTEPTAKGTKRSVQVFDAAGEAVHKIHLVAESRPEAFDRLVAELRLAEQTDAVPFTAVVYLPPGPAADPAGWQQMPADLFAARLAAEGQRAPDLLAALPEVRSLRPEAMTELLERSAAAAVPLEIRGGTAGCLQVFRGQVARILPAGYWINVMDPAYNLHLRTDHLARVFLTDRGPEGALSVEAYDADGSLILTVTGGAGWENVVAALSAA
ncbi:ChuX/HutX family heme-like substrate-binding protein [Cereibacter johrii]|uniref:ChuX/HutX family heme-like substrate-binding protein n=1 Tax=Cereibacter johrii TaxID=445629 RepID=UPI003CF06001